MTTISPPLTWLTLAYRGHRSAKKHTGTALKRPQPSTTALLASFVRQMGASATYVFCGTARSLDRGPAVCYSSLVRAQLWPQPACPAPLALLCCLPPPQGLLGGAHVLVDVAASARGRLHCSQSSAKQQRTSAVGAGSACQASRRTSSCQRQEESSLDAGRASPMQSQECRSTSTAKLLPPRPHLLAHQQLELLLSCLLLHIQHLGRPRSSSSRRPGSAASSITSTCRGLGTAQQPAADTCQIRAARL